MPAITAVWSSADTICEPRAGKPYFCRMTFTDLNLSAALLNALQDLRYTQPTPIQEKAFPVIMSGRDLLGIAQTGTGKTFAYLLPLLRQWTFSRELNPTVVVLVPTRELVVQVVREAEKLSTYQNTRVLGVYGGTNINTQAEAVLNGCDLLVGTPGRLLDLALNGSLRLKNVKKIVLDEVDEMLSLGFRSQLTRIMDLLPAKRQHLFFSATVTEEVEAFMEQHFADHAVVEAAPSGTPPAEITQRAVPVANFHTKVNLLKHLLNEKSDMSRVLVFTASRSMADRLFEQIAPDFTEQVGIIHSNKDQNFRFRAVRQFREGETRVLIATDLVSRGIDIQGVTHVINFDVPEVAENYVHRIGRTGRADARGEALTFYTPREEEALEAAEELMQLQIERGIFPENVNVSDVLIEEELPRYKHKVAVARARREPGEAFHDKKEKNKKVNRKITRAEAMRLKYGKPKTKGDKGKKKRK